MDYKKNFETKHFYTYTPFGWMKKSDKPYLFIFYNIIEKTLNDFPKIKNKELNIIKKFLKNLYLIFSKEEYFDILLKYTIYLEKKAEEIEKIGKKKLKNFIDFSEIDNREIKELNNLRINLRILESLFWIVAKELPDNGKFLVIPHFLNVASKYVFYYIVVNYDFCESSEKDAEEEIEFDKDLFENYKKLYLNKKLSDYL